MDPATLKMIEVGAGIASQELINGLKQLGVIEKVRLKLLNDPDKASVHLERVFSELQGVVKLVSDACFDVSEVSMDTAGEKRAARVYFRKLKTKGLEPEIKKARVACKRIKTIHRTYLRGWFSRALNKRDAQKMETLFSEMSVVDNHLVSGLEHLSGYLTTLGTKGLEGMDGKGKAPGQFSRLLRTVEKELDKVLRAANVWLGKLITLFAEFHNISKKT